MSEPIAWGEDDVRDAMSYFDPAAEELRTVGLFGRRGNVTALAYWADAPIGAGRRGYVGGHIGGDHVGRFFEDPIEAIAFAIDFGRQEVPT